MTRFLSILLIFLLSQQVLAQTDSTKISGIFMGMPFSRFAKSIEDDSDFRFIYKQSDVEALTINLQAQNVELRTLLTQVFSGSGLFFTIDSQKQVWITKGKPLTLDFPS
ncbi:MAG TPA: STN domain-containing protein, partial [Algoriphagus sp.]|nr:STN domain-containing protein [Algoriphagus sp.]